VQQYSLQNEANLEVLPALIDAMEQGERASLVTEECEATNPLSLSLSLSLSRSGYKQASDLE